MLTHPGELVEAAKKAGMKVPPNPNDYKKEQFPHFFVFCDLQLGRNMPYPSVHLDNAAVLIAFSVNEIKTVTASQLIQAGFNFGS